MYVCVRVLSEVRNCKLNTNRLVFDLDWFICFILRILYFVIKKEYVLFLFI